MKTISQLSEKEKTSLNQVLHFFIFKISRFKSDESSSSSDSTIEKSDEKFTRKNEKYSLEDLNNISTNAE